MIVSQQMHRLIADQEGWTRKMFGAAVEMKKAFGEDKVYDFSLGNPDVEPPEAVQKSLLELASNGTPGMHRYMENPGYEEVRQNVAAYLGRRYGLPFASKHVFMSVGCAGGLNTLLKAMLNKRDEVIVPKPFFWEFKNYIENFGGLIRLVESKPDFQMDVGKIEKSITPKTRAILVNSPNNPTGIVYTEQNLRDLAALLNRKREEGQEIFLIADEAYRKLVYDGITLPNLFDIYDLTAAITSHSKDLALPGERIGYIALSPKIPDLDLLLSGLAIASRCLGYVNAPALFQRIAGRHQDASVDIAEYQRKRDLFYGSLTAAGYECVKPTGAFYMFPKAPVADELDFIFHLQKEERILVVPGRGFGSPGFFRIAFCVPYERIEASLDGFKRAFERYYRSGKRR